jgi:hypothetical protein
MTTKRGGVPARAPATTFAVWRGSRSNQPSIFLRHVPIDAGHANCLGAHRNIVDNVVDVVPAS